MLRGISIVDNKSDCTYKTLCPKYDSIDGMEVDMDETLSALGRPIKNLLKPT